MNKVREILVGNNRNAPCIAYGDESSYEEILTYAFAIVHRVNLEKIDSLIEKIRDKYSIPHDISLHCRILFNSSARENNKLGHLEDEDVKNIILDIVSAMGDICLLRYAYFVAPSEFDFDKIVMTTFQSTDGSPPPKFPIKYDKKGILGLLMLVCFAVPPDGKKWPTPDKCEIFVSEDYSRIHFLGTKRSRADNYYRGISDIGAPPGCVFRLNPVILKSDDATLLQVADILSYICPHAISKKCRNYFFKYALNLVRRKTSGVLNLDIR